MEFSAACIGEYSECLSVNNSFWVTAAVAVSDAVSAKFLVFNCKAQLYEVELYFRSDF